jgi:hypothetical protein
MLGIYQLALPALPPLRRFPLPIFMCLRGEVYLAIQDLMNAFRVQNLCCLSTKIWTSLQTVIANRFPLAMSLSPSSAPLLCVCYVCIYVSCPFCSTIRPHKCPNAGMPDQVEGSPRPPSQLAGPQAMPSIAMDATVNAASSPSDATTGPSGRDEGKRRPGNVMVLSNGGADLQHILDYDMAEGTVVVVHWLAPWVTASTTAAVTVRRCEVLDCRVIMERWGTIKEDFAPHVHG